MPWKELGLYFLFSLLDSKAGLPSLRTWIWVPVEQYAHQTLTTAAYHHILSLSGDFHAGKDASECYVAVIQGRRMNELLELILFQVLPMFADLGLAFAYFFFIFDINMAFIVTIVSAVYLLATRFFNSERTENRLGFNTTTEGSLILT